MYSEKKKSQKEEEKVKVAKEEPLLAKDRQHKGEQKGKQKKSLRFGEGCRVLWNKTKNLFRPAKAKSAAGGAPQQKMAPAEHTYKRQEKEAAMAETSAQYNEYADERSYQMAEQLYRDKAARDLSRRQYQKEHPNDPIPADLHRLMGVYLEGYRVDQNGNPATEEDRIKKERDHQNIARYCSSDRAVKEKRLDEITDEVLSVNFTESMFQEEYLTKHISQMMQDAQLLISYDNVSKEKANLDYMKRMDPLKKELIDAKVNALYPFIGTYLGLLADEKGIDIQTGKFHDKAIAKRRWELAKEQLPTYQKLVTDALAESRRLTAEVEEKMKQRAQNAEASG